MSDIFQEVSEELQREKMAQFWKRYGSTLLGAALVLVLATAGWSFYASRTARINAENTAALLTAVETGETDKILEFSKNAKTMHAVLADFIAASQLTEKGDVDKAIALYDGIAERPMTDELYTGLARILKVSLKMDQPSPDLDALLAELSKLDSDKSPWRYSARELEGLIAAQKGKYGDAVKTFEGLANDSIAPAGMRARAMALAQIYNSLTESGDKKNAS